jgi:hypothetical protein
MNNQKPIFLIFLLLVLLAACTNYGTKLTFNNGELFYTKNVTEDEANMLGKFLVADGFFSGDQISVQLDKKDDRYLFRMASREGVEDSANFLSLAKEYTGRLSTEVFNGAPVDFQFCDTHLKTKKEIPYTPSPAVTDSIAY